MLQELETSLDARLPAELKRQGYELVCPVSKKGNVHNFSIRVLVDSHLENRGASPMKLILDLTGAKKISQGAIVALSDLKRKAVESGGRIFIVNVPDRYLDKFDWEDMVELKPTSSSELQ